MKYLLKVILGTGLFIIVTAGGGKLMEKSVDGTNKKLIAKLINNLQQEAKGNPEMYTNINMSTLNCQERQHAITVRFECSALTHQGKKAYFKNGEPVVKI
jgi:predicted Rossmann-fold nucleotide-binding protein